MTALHASSWLAHANLGGGEVQCVTCGGFSAATSKVRY